MLVTDLSRLVPAPIEPRGFAGVNINPPVGQTSHAQLQALSPGGVFVEIMLLRGESPAQAENHRLDVSNQDLALPAAPNLNVGGTTILSAFTAGSLVVPITGVTFPSPTGFEAVTIPLGIFVPNQAFFTVRSFAVGTRLDVALIYRELPSVEEVG